MLRILLLFAISTTMLTAFAQQESYSLKGTVLDEETNEPIPFANVTLLQDGNQLLGTTTDFNGKFELKMIPVGEYTLGLSYVGYQTKSYKQIIVPQKRKLDITMKQGITISCCGCYIKHIPPLLEKDITTTGQDFSRRDIQNLATF